MTAAGFRRHMRAQYKGLTHVIIGERLGITASFVGQLLSGARQPSKKVLTAMGFEKVVTYRKAAKPDRQSC